MGKQIELYLLNNTINGAVTIDIHGWAGKAIKIPRTEVEGGALSDELNQKTGVYFLMCLNEDTGKESVYIGESLDIKKRLKQHMRDYSNGKETFYWRTAVAFVSPQLNETRITYMENVLTQQAKSCNNYEILTKATKTSLKVDLGTQDSCNQFIEEIKMLLGLLDYKIFDDTGNEKVSDSKILYCKGAKGFVSAGGFTVLKGSKVEDIRPSLKGLPYYELRRKLEKNKTIENGAFTKDCDEFKAPSAASSVVLGRPSNGQKKWKNASGVLLKDL